MKKCFVFLALCLFLTIHISCNPDPKNACDGSGVQLYVRSEFGGEVKTFQGGKDAAVWFGTSLSDRRGGQGLGLPIEKIAPNLPCGSVYLSVNSNYQQKCDLLLIPGTYQVTKEPQLCPGGAFRPKVNGFTLFFAGNGKDLNNNGYIDPDTNEEGSPFESGQIEIRQITNSLIVGIFSFSFKGVSQRNIPAGKIEGCFHSATVGAPIIDPDADGDGFADKKAGGTDCDDQDPNIHPAAIEVPANKKDDNCNGQVDEYALKVGHWKLESGKGEQINIDIRNNPTDGTQYIRCLQIKFKLQSKTGSSYVYTQWRTALSPTAVPIISNKFRWNLDDSGDPLKIKMEGKVRTATTIAIDLEAKDTDPKVDGQDNFYLLGEYVSGKASDDASIKFCRHCYNGECPEQK